MRRNWKRRELIKQGLATSAALLLPVGHEATEKLPQILGKDCEIRISSVSAYTVRLSIVPLESGRARETPLDDSLLHPSFGSQVAAFRGNHLPSSAIQCGDLTIAITLSPLTFSIASAKTGPIQKLSVGETTCAVSFSAGASPLLALGEGGRQFDRRGELDPMISGQGGYHLHTHGGRVPIPWLMSTSGWAMFFHQPYGSFDLSGATAKFLPASPSSALPLDLFFVASQDPATLLSEYARLTGLPELPPLWSFGYQQSHRTLASEEEVLREAATFREKRLPCDAMIYLGTGFCPSGWNTENGSFVWNSRVFPDPPKTIDALHKKNFRTVVHVVILSDKLRGSVRDSCDVTRFDESEASCHWNNHRKDFAMGVDGWWPDEGDPLDIPSRLVRNRMYWEGPQLDRPSERPYALHRNGYAGMQRYASFLWSGDVYSTWETLKTQVPVGINTGLTGIPYWGTDIGGFVPTSEFTAELFVRWFQFGAFCPLFRSHGRAWKLRLPWGWNTGDTGPREINNYGGAALPDESQLHNPQVEPICRKYLELRYRLLPYLYSVVRESTQSGLPIMRALWLHYPDDPKAAVRGDQYLWGRDILVAPVVEKGATSRSLYLPRGRWYDFWTGEQIEGGREINRPVDLETMPLYVRAGAVLPLGPVKQYTAEPVDEPCSLLLLPGADGSFSLYDDDGISFQYRRGEWTGIDLSWHDSSRILTLALSPGSRMTSVAARKFHVKLGDSIREITFNGKPIDVPVL